MNAEMKSILIVDDQELNRELLAEGFSGKYNIIEAENGNIALEKLENAEEGSIAAILLDLIMPVMDGIAVLRKLKETGLSERIPVLVITTATPSSDEEMLMDAYRLGAADIIQKPFMMNFLICRVENMIELFRHRTDLEKMVDEQVKKLSAINISMIELLSELIEFRDCESGEHVKRICVITDILLRKAGELYPEYRLEDSKREKIVTSAMLHDIGKIAIPDNILGKPGRLTESEFELMKQHTMRGWTILGSLSGLMDEELYSYCRDICRHHHERWDGKGYPDGLSGDGITLWAQVASVADVYDALTSKRVYKSAFSHEKAVKMITGGECGCFNPKIMEAFIQCEDALRQLHK